MAVITVDLSVMNIFLVTLFLGIGSAAVEEPGLLRDCDFIVFYLSNRRKILSGNRKDISSFTYRLHCSWLHCFQYRFRAIGRKGSWYVILSVKDVPFQFKSAYEAVVNYPIQSNRSEIGLPLVLWGQPSGNEPRYIIPKDRLVYIPHCIHYSNKSPAMFVAF